MATLRLFASLREIAGTSRVEIPGKTVGDVIDGAVDRFGQGFAESLSRARIWVNGDEADTSQSLSPDDEIALIPPVSGGAGAIADTPTVGMDLIAPVAVFAALIFANLVGGVAWWAAAIVGLVGLWAGDVAATSIAWGRDLPLSPALVTILTAIVSVHLLGVGGMGLTLAVGVAAPLAWAVASDSSRVLASLTAATVLSVTAGGAVASLFLARASFEPMSRGIGVFLIVALVATAVGLLLERFSRFPIGDPFSAAALSAVIASVVSAAVWDLDVVAFLMAGLALALALIGGRALGSMLRTRRVLLLEHPPGYLSLLDGVVLAAWIYFPTLLLVFP